jgi:hypothetical protein
LRRADGGMKLDELTLRVGWSVRAIWWDCWHYAVSRLF